MRPRRPTIRAARSTLLTAAVAVVAAACVPADDPQVPELDPEPPAPDAVAPLDVEPRTDRHERDAVDARLTLTDVRVGHHDGFDRVVLELAGEGEVGWSIALDQEPTSQGSGEPIETDGDHALTVALHGMLLPPDAPDHHDRWERGREPGPDPAVVTEVVDDTIFEGIQQLVVGLEQPVELRVDRFTDPQRVVIDLERAG